MKNLFLFLFLLMLPMLSPAATTTAAPAETITTTTEAAPKRPKRKHYALKAQRGKTRLKFSAVGKFRRRGAGCRISLPQIGRPAAVN